MTDTKTVDLDWNNLGFEYMDLPYRYRAYWKDGEWHKAGLVEDSSITINEGSPIVHYGQGCFEGMKAYRCKDGSVNLFRPDQNAARMQRSCQRLLMPEVPTEMFVDALKQVVRANQAYIPPYGTGGTLYLRPYMIGVGENIGVHPATEYIFSVFAMPVGNYFMTVPHIKVLVNPKSAATMQPAFFLAILHTSAASQTAFTLIRLNIKRLKKLVRLTSSALRATVNS